MSEKISNLKRMQLADALKSYPSSQNATPPRSGWVRAIREALGMTQAQLSARLNISRQSVQDLERAEVERDGLGRVPQAHDEESEQPNRTTDHVAHETYRRSARRWRVFDAQALTDTGDRVRERGRECQSDNHDLSLSSFGPRLARWGPSGAIER